MARPPPTDNTHPTATVHASCVALKGRGLLILGPPGAGKSALALDLMALGCGLVADDQTIVDARDGALWATCPPPLSGLIEARGIGLLNAAPVPSARLTLAIDLGVSETERLPQRRKLSLLDIDLPLLHKPSTGPFAAALLQYLKEGRRE